MVSQETYYPVHCSLNIQQDPFENQNGIILDKMYIIKAFGWKKVTNEEATSQTMRWINIIMNGIYRT